MSINSRPILGVIDGAMPPPEWAESCLRRGLRLEPGPATAEAGGDTRILLGRADAERIEAGLSRPFSGFVEYAPGTALEPPPDCIAAAAGGGLALAISTRGIFGTEVATRLSAAIARRIPLEDDTAQCLELAVAEGIGNAAIHGNLGIESDLRGSMAALEAYRRVLKDRLADPELSRRPVVVTAIPTEDGIEVVIRDQGRGYDLDQRLALPASQNAKSGRGLGLIRQLARTVSGRDGGRVLVMTFPRRGA